MRIALLAKRHSIHTVRWANALAQHGHEVHLISSVHHGEPLDPAVRFWPLPVPPPVGFFANAPALRRVLREVEPDVLHAHYASGYGTLGRLGGFRPYVLSVWGADVYDFPDRSALHRRLLTANLRAPDHLCSTSRVMAERTRELLPGADVSVVPFGVDVDRFRPATRTGSGDEVTVGTVKTLAPKYGVDLLLRAFARLREGLAADGDGVADRLRLLVVGGGPDEARLRALADELGIAEATRFVGAVPHAEVPAWLARLDVYVALSRLDSESFGVAVLEASAVGLPVVVSDVGGLPEVVVDGVTGKVVPREDPVAAAVALRELVLDPARRAAMGAAGRRHVEKEYAWEASVEAMSEVYARVAGGPR